jgi:hypothetical protein
VIGETLELQNRGFIKHVNSMAARNTCSYSIASATMHNSPYKKSEIAQKYFTSRKLANIPFPSPFITSINGVWQNLLNFMGKQYNISDIFDERLTFFPLCDAMEYIANGKEITKQLLENILRQPVRLFDIPIQNQKVEDRVESFEKTCAQISNNKQIHPQSASFVIACLANQISPGTMRHYSLLAPFSKIYPGLYTWYGLCAGLVPNSDVFSYNGGLGWRISRQIMAEPSIFDYPISDICFNEFELLQTLENPDTTFNTDWANNLSIELVPGIAILIPWPPKANQGAGLYSNENQKQLNFFGSESHSVSIETFGKKLFELVDMFNNLTPQKRKYYSDENKQKAKGTKGKSKY